MHWFDELPKQVAHVESHEAHVKLEVKYYAVVQLTAMQDGAVYRLFAHVRQALELQVRQAELH